MNSEPADMTPSADPPDRGAIIRSALERDPGPIIGKIRVMIRLVGRSRGIGGYDQCADDIVSRAFCQALEHPGTYDPGRPVSDWIVGIARNLLRNEARGDPVRRHRVELDEAAWEAMVDGPGSVDGGASATIDIERMLSRLSPMDRRLIELRHDKRSHREVAETLGLPSANAARQRFHRALQSLRDLYARDGSEVAR